MSNIKPNIQTSNNLFSNFGNLSQNLGSALLGQQASLKIDVEDRNGNQIMKFNGNDLSESEADYLKSVESRILASVETMTSGDASLDKQAIFNNQMDGALTLFRQTDFSTDSLSRNFVESNISANLAMTQQAIASLNSPSTAFQTQAANPRVQAGYAAAPTNFVGPPTAGQVDRSNIALLQGTMNALMGDRIQNNPQFRSQIQQVLQQKLGGNQTIPLTMGNNLRGMSVNSPIIQSQPFMQTFGANPSAFTLNNFNNTNPQAMSVLSQLGQMTNQITGMAMNNQIGTQASNAGAAIDFTGMNIGDILHFIFESSIKNKENDIAQAAAAIQSGVKGKDGKKMVWVNGKQINEDEALRLLQKQAQKLNQAVQTLSTLTNNLHTTAKAVIGNMRA